MTETDSVALPTAPPRRWPWVLLSLLLLAVIVAGGVQGWRLWRIHAATEDLILEQHAQILRQGHEISDAQAQIEALREHAADLAEGEHRDADAITALQGRAQDFDRALQALSTSVQGGRIRAQLIAVEQVLLIANDRVQLAKDAPGAAVALQLAQDRLATLSAPQLFEVRKAIADERAALLAVPAADRTTVSLSLSGLIERAPSLPRREQAKVAPPAPVTDTARRDTGLWASIQRVFVAMFGLHRVDRPIRPLMLPEEQALVGDLLELRLESARLALLRGDTESFRGSVAAALDLLTENYQVEDAAVVAARKELDGLAHLDLSPPLPDISRSLGLLRAYLDSAPK